MSPKILARMAILSLGFIATGIQASKNVVRDVAEKSHIKACGLRRKTIAYIDPIRGTEAQALLDHYVPLSTPAGGPRASIMILPPTGGETVLDRLYARRLCKQGFGVVLIKTWSYDREATLDFSSHDNGYIRADLVIHKILELTPGRFGVLGTSVGSFYAATALAKETRIEAATIIVGGAPLSRVLAYSTIPDLKKLRQARMNHYNLSDEAAYEARMKQEIRMDASHFLPLARRKPVFMVVATQDTIVPTDTQETLWQELGQPERHDIKSGHLTAIVKTYLHYRNDIDSFFLRELGN